MNGSDDHEDALPASGVEERSRGPSFLNDEPTPPLPRGICGRWPALTYVLPFVVFMLGTFFEPSRPEPSKYANIDESKLNFAERELLHQKREEEKVESAKQIPYEHYPVVYTGKIVATVIAMLIVLPGYLTWRPFRVSGLAWAVGGVGAVVWILLAKLQVSLYPHLPSGVGKLLEMGGRAGFNPLTELPPGSAWSYGFLAIRFFGLVVVIAVVEEFFLRGFLMRYVMHIDWFKIPFGVMNGLGLAAVIGFPVLAHPERLAALAWFSMVTWLMLRTRNIWDCVIAHAVTNLLMGLWVVYSGDWWMM
jgi:CAAX prenyl protease-like protein